MLLFWRPIEGGRDAHGPAKEEDLATRKGPVSEALSDGRYLAQSALQIGMFFAGVGNRWGNRPSTFTRQSVSSCEVVNLGRDRGSTESAFQFFFAADTSTQTTPLLPSWSAITVSEGALLSSTTVPPAATAAAIRCSATSGAT